MTERLSVLSYILFRFFFIEVILISDAANYLLHYKVGVTECHTCFYSLICCVLGFQNLLASNVLEISGCTHQFSIGVFLSFFVSFEQHSPFTLHLEPVEFAKSLCYIYY